jgi:hypothetical protein
MRRGGAHEAPTGRKGVGGVESERSSPGPLRPSPRPARHLSRYGHVGLPDDLDTSVPSRSAGREHARRKANRERAVRERHPRIGGAVLALTDAPQSERAWLTGQDGEEHVGASLQARVSGHVVLLHDRRIPGSRANIDHIAVAPSGIWVIDTKRYTGRVRVRAPLFGHPKLLIAGRDRSNLADGLAKQVDVVQDARGDSTQVPVYGAFCFVEADLPMLSKLTFRGFPLLYPRQLARRLNDPGPVPEALVGRLARSLADRFPAA